MTAEHIDKGHLSIGDVLELLIEDFPDVTISKIRFLESKGLISPERTPSGYRRFYHSDVERLKSILLLQKEHYLPLDVIKSRLDKNHLYNIATHAQLSLSFFQPEEETNFGQAGKQCMDEATASITATGEKDFFKEKSSLEVINSLSTKNNVFQTIDGDSYLDKSDKLLSVDGNTPDSTSMSRYRIEGAQSGQDSTTANDKSSNSFQRSKPYGMASKIATESGTISAGSQQYIYSTMSVDDVSKDQTPVEVNLGDHTADIVSIPNRGLNNVFTGATGSDYEATKEHSGKRNNLHAAVGVKQVLQSGNGSDSKDGAAGQSTNSDLRDNQVKKSASAKRPSVSKEKNDAKSSTQSPGEDVRVITKSVGATQGFSDSPILPTTYSKEELIVAAEIDTQLFLDLVEYGLIKAKKIAGEQLFGDRDVNVARIVASYAAFGIGPRHLRSLKHAAEREVSMYQQTIMPLLRQRNPESRYKAVGNMEVMAQLGKDLKDLFLRMEIDDILGGSNL